MSRWLTAYRMAHERALRGGAGTEGHTAPSDPMLPAAALRGSHSFYADTSASPSEIRICQGTSCMLSGARDSLDKVGRHHACRKVYCIGYCDHAPAALLPDGRPVLRATPDLIESALAYPPSQPPLPDVRVECGAPIILERIVSGDHASLDRAQGAGVYNVLREALAESPDAIVQTLVDSGERGRGGAAYPTGVKWKQTAQAAGVKKYVVANGDEGDPGSFIDRVLMEFDPHTILEGMAIAAYAVGADEGVVYIRSEYPRAAEVMRGAIRDATEANLLGADVLQRGFDFHVSVFVGRGSYVCGEETALLNAIEGLRGEVRLRPPYPAVAGLFNRPTLVDNVETLCNVPSIIRHGAAAYRARGTASSSGTKALCLNRGFGRPGIVEVEFGTPLRTVIEQYGAGAAPGQELAAVIMGGPMGSLVARDDWDVPICYDTMARRELRLGHGGLVAVPEGTDWRLLLEHWLEFMAHESCGKCVPCRLGSKRLLALARSHRPADGHTFESIFSLMEDASLCAFGKLMPGPMRDILRLASRA